MDANDKALLRAVDKTVDRRKERDVEETFGKRLLKVSQGRLLSRKFTSPSRRADPDRIILCSNKEGRVAFVEMKRSGEEPTPAQAKKHRELRRMGYLVLVCAGDEQIDATVNELIDYFLWDD